MLNPSNTNIPTTAERRKNDLPQPTGERYKICCGRCREDIEIAVTSVKAGVGACPKCGMNMVLDWSALHRKVAGAAAA
jgi:hypothetical protein